MENPFKIILKKIRKGYQDFFYSQYVFLERNAHRKGYFNTWVLYFLVRLFILFFICIYLEVEYITTNRIVALSMIGFSILDYFWILNKESKREIKSWYNNKEPNKYMYFLIRLGLVLVILSPFISIFFVYDNFVFY